MGQLVVKFPMGINQRAYSTVNDVSHRAQIITWVKIASTSLGGPGERKNKRAVES